MYVDFFTKTFCTRVQFPSSPPNETLSELRKRSDFAGAKIALSISLPPTAEAVNSQSSPQLHESVLSLRMGLEPIFWKNSFHAKYFSPFSKIPASLKDKTKLRKGSTQFFLCCPKSLKLSSNFRSEERRVGKEG